LFFWGFVGGLLLCFGFKIPCEKKEKNVEAGKSCKRNPMGFVNELVPDDNPTTLTPVRGGTGSCPKGSERKAGKGEKVNEKKTLTRKGELH